MSSPQAGRSGLRGSFAGLLILILALTVVGCGSDEPDPPPPPDPDPEGYIGPVVSLITPARAAMVEKGTLEDCPVNITGRVCDDVHTISYLEINEDPVTLPGTGEVCETFSLTEDCRYGLNIVKGKAMSNVGSFTYLAHSFIRSPGYFPASTTPTEAARVSNATFLQLGQDFFDDGDPDDLDDVASVAAYAINRLDFDALIPGFTYATPDGNNDGVVDREGCLTYTCYKTGYRIYKDGEFTLESIDVGLTLIDGGLEATIVMNKPYLPLNVHGYFKECPICLNSGADTEVTANSITLTSRVRVAVGADGATVVTFDKAEVATDGLDVDVDFGWADKIADAITNPLKSKALDLVKEKIEAAASGSLNGILGKYLGDALRENLFIANQSITLPKLGTKLLVDAGVETIEFTPDRAWISGYTFVRPEKPSAAHASVPYGAPRYGGTAPSLDNDTVYGIGIKDDLLNQFLWAVWLAGDFDMPNLSEYLDADDVSIGVFSSLPPVVMSRVGGMAFDVGWGDMKVDLSMTPAAVERLGLDESEYFGIQRSSDGMIEIEAYVSAFMSFDFRIDQEAYTLNPSQNFVDLSLQITKIHDPKALEAFTQELESKLNGALPEILQKVLAEYPLPKYNLDAIGGLQDQVLRMGVPEITRQGNFYTLSGNLIPVPKP